MAFLKKWRLSGLNRLVNSDRSRSSISYYDKKIAKLEQEYQNLIDSSPCNMARLAQIISELGKLWNAKLRDEVDKELAKRDGAKDIWQLQEAVNEIMREGKKKMTKAQSKEEIRAAFTEGMDKMICLMGE